MLLGSVLGTETAIKSLKGPGGGGASGSHVLYGLGEGVLCGCPVGVL